MINLADIYILWQCHYAHKLQRRRMEQWEARKIILELTRVRDVKAKDVLNCFL